MWAIRKPEIDDAISDIDIFKNDDIINSKDATALKKLVRLYDSQKGYVTDKQINEISSKGAESIHSNYDRMELRGPYGFIRQKLYENVTKCPFCGIGFIETLDHYMHKNSYKALSLCRMNLVPMCWNCNKKKGIHIYNEFIHPYYVNVIPGSIFLNATLSVKQNEFIVSFSIDKNSFTNVAEYNRFCKHIKHMDLDNRLRKSVIDFIHSEVLSLSSDKEILKISVNNLISKYESPLSYGLNDWRTAVLRAFRAELEGNTSDVIIAVLKIKKSQIRNINI